MRNLSKLTFQFLMPAAMILAVAGEAGAQDDMTARIALGDIASVETLNLLIALEHAKERGVDIELTAFKSEDIANQAVVNGQADIGVGVPYPVIQKVDAPIRMFYRLSELRFFPVVDKKYESWEDLDGEEIAVHSRGSGTEAAANIMADKHGITYKNISYVPGSEVRALALLNDSVDATFLDIANTDFVMAKAPGEFHLLPMGDLEGTDEALFARTDWLDENQETVQILIEELLKVTRAINEDPGYVAAERERLGLLADLPEDLAAEIQPYFEQAVEAQLFPQNGGSAEGVKADFDFYTAAGQLEGSPEELKVEDFWYLEPLEKAQAAVGG
ncbi:ABC transporter substrate-binding protein [Virgifigura deserti]|uniref:ABC transporter substrate-binding protein n=1 Tax=Virgifigura deserti TaxID=2268457 RepID=UPI003CCB956C